jgi:hypothetical protein
MVIAIFIVAGCLTLFVIAKFSKLPLLEGRTISTAPGYP